MINFFYETKFVLQNPNNIINWINNVILSESKSIGEINYIFCDDSYLLNINQQYLNHDTFTDIITFNYNDKFVINGDIFISVDRVQENAHIFNVDFDTELRRVIIHGVLHLCGFNDKTTEESTLMREKENEKLLLFHVEQ